MDTQKFAKFIADTRKCRGMTQKDLAQLLHITDKAVSRWERGMGFPDIAHLEPLAQALEVSLVELMQAQADHGDTVSKDSASRALTETVQAARRQHRRSWLRLGGWLGGIAAVIAFWFLFTGFLPRTDAFIYEYAVLPSGGAITIHTGVAGSMGYIRSCRNVSDDPEEMILVFSAAFGGLNSSFGARDVFTLPLEEECQTISILGSDGANPALLRDANGNWVRAQ